MRVFLNFIIVILTIMLPVSESCGDSNVIDTSNSASATTPSHQRRTFFDSVHNQYWIFYYNGSEVEYAYSSDASTWTVAGSLPYNTTNYSIASKQIENNCYLVFSVQTNTYDIVLRRGLVGVSNILFEEEVTALDGTGVADAYSLNQVAIDVENKIWLVSVFDASNDLDDKVITVVKTTNVLTEDISAFSTIQRLGKPDRNRRSVAIMSKGTGGMYLLSGESSKNLEAWEYVAGEWVAKNSGGDMSWFGMQGSPIMYAPWAIAISGNDVYVGGAFSGYIYRWDGASWHALGHGLNNEVNTLVILGTDLYAGGMFTDAGGIAEADYVARWDGTDWHALGSGVNGDVYVLAVSETNLYVGGSFTDAGGIAAADRIARWDGTSWNALGNGLSYLVYDLAIIGADLYVGGLFSDAGGVVEADGIARWDGTSWHALGLGLDFEYGAVYSLAISGTSLYVAGDFSNAGGVVGAATIANWDGANWHAFGLGSGLNSIVYALAISGTDVYVGGVFNDAGGVVEADGIAKWDGTSWHALGPGLSGIVYSIVASGTDVYVGGSLQNAGGIAEADGMARWDGTNWHAIGGGLSGFEDYVGEVYSIAISGSDINPARMSFEQLLAQSLVIKN